MERINPVGLTAKIFWEIIRYEVVFAVCGFPGVHSGLRSPITSRVQEAMQDRAVAGTICKAFDAVSSFYWKQMVCLQRSVITARVMHAYGIPASVVIGYRFAPFVGHAWVEVNGVVVNDSPGYAEKLMVLERIGPAVSAA